MKWKVPLYVGIPPARRHGHAAFIIHSHVCLRVCVSVCVHACVYYGDTHFGGVLLLKHNPRLGVMQTDAEQSYSCHPKESGLSSLKQFTIKSVVN